MPSAKDMERRTAEVELRALWERAAPVAELRELAGAWVCRGLDLPRPGFLRGLLLDLAGGGATRRWTLTVVEGAKGAERVESRDGSVTRLPAEFRLRRGRLQKWTGAWIRWETVGDVRMAGGDLLVERSGAVHRFRRVEPEGART